MNIDSGQKTSDELKASLKYARKRLIVGAAIGFLSTLTAGYFWAWYKHNIPLNAGYRLFWYPIIGLGWIVLSFFGAVVGAIASLFTKKWKEKNL